MWFLQKGTEGQKERREREIVHIKKGAGMCCVHVPTSGRECKHTQHLPKNGRRSRDGCAEGKGKWMRKGMEMCYVHVVTTYKECKRTIHVY